MLALLIQLSSCKKSDPTPPAQPKNPDPVAVETKTPVVDETVDKVETVVEEVKAPVVEEVVKPVVEEVKAPVVEEVKAPAGAMVPIPIELPKPMFVGTPQNIIVPGGKLEKATGKPREPFLAPAGVTNVAAGKPVTASDDFPVIGEVEMVTDGDKEGADGSYVDLGPFLQYVTIDLEENYEIYAVAAWHFHKQGRAYVDVVVQLADDPDFTTNVRTIFNNDHDNSAGLGVGQDWHYVETSEGKLIDAKGQKARYVRLYSDGNSSDDSTHYIEVEVYGKK